MAANTPPHQLAMLGEGRNTHRAGGCRVGSRQLFDPSPPPQRADPGAIGRFNHTAGQPERHRPGLALDTPSEVRTAQGGLHADTETVAPVEAEVVAELAVEVLVPVELDGGPLQRGCGATPKGLVGVEESGFTTQGVVVLGDGGDGAVLVHHTDRLVPDLRGLAAVGSGAEDV